mgnify:CR=1 FL=1
MTKQEFLILLAQQQFPEPVLVEQPANGQLGLHRHDFAVNALVVEGSIKIELEGHHSTYRVGDVFHLEFRQPHFESYGPQGVKYLASRKIAPA